MESYLSKCAAGLAPPDWLTQTTWSGQSGPRVFQHRTKLRPMRPKPLIATLILSSATTVFLTAACKRKERRAQIAGQSSKSGEESHQRGKIYNVYALCFSSFEHPLPPFIFASFGGPYYPLFWGRSTSLQDIWKHTPRARHHHQHSRRGHHSMASSIMGSPLLSLFVVKVATRFRASASSSSSSRDGRRTGGAIDSDRALSLCIFSLFHSRSLVTTSCRGLFEKMHTKRLKNESAKKRTLATVRFLNWPETAENCVSWVV